VQEIIEVITFGSVGDANAPFFEAPALRRASRCRLAGIITVGKDDDLLDIR
jgi:hypothetical protein